MCITMTVEATASCLLGGGGGDWYQREAIDHGAHREEGEYYAQTTTGQWHHAFHGRCMQHHYDMTTCFDTQVVGKSDIVRYVNE